MSSNPSQSSFFALEIKKRVNVLGVVAFPLSYTLVVDTQMGYHRRH